MHKVKQRRSRVPIYTNYEGDYIDLESDDDVVVDGDEETPPDANESWLR
jgi:hypothetical protein